MTEIVLTGNHYKVVFVAPSAQLRSEERLFGCLRAIVKAIDCKIVAGPLIATMEESEEAERCCGWEDTGGISGVVVLSTSHVAAHFWTQERYGVIDAYSCKPFEVCRLVDTLRTHYDVAHVRAVDLTADVVGIIRFEEVRNEEV